MLRRGEIARTASCARQRSISRLHGALVPRPLPPSVLCAPASAGAHGDACAAKVYPPPSPPPTLSHHGKKEKSGHPRQNMRKEGRARSLAFHVANAMRVASADHGVGCEKAKVTHSRSQRLPRRPDRAMAGGSKFAAASNRKRPAICPAARAALRCMLMLAIQASSVTSAVVGSTQGPLSAV